jgi:glutaredoxin
MNDSPTSAGAESADTGSPESGSPRAAQSLAGRHALGLILFFAGCAIFALILADSLDGIPFAMPRSWYVHRALWGVAGALSIAAAWGLQRSGPKKPAAWRPRVAGKRFDRLVIYTREECHLCDEAKALLTEYLEYLPEIEEVDIDTDPQLQERYGTKIPVVEFDGRPHFFGHVDEHLLRRLIEGNVKSEEIGRS